MKQIFVVEGPEYVGKTSVCNTVQTLIPDIYIAREPGGTPVGEQVREILKGNSLDNTSYFFGMWLSRSLLINNLKQKQYPVALFDRFDLSTLAYQVIYNDATDLLDHFFSNRKILLEDLDYQVNYIVLGADRETVLERKRQAWMMAERSDLDSVNDMLEKTYSNHQKLAESYEIAFQLLKAWDICNKENSVYIDTSDLSPEQVSKQVKEFILPKLR